MNTITLGMRNAFRNATRSLSIVIILGLSIGLSMVMLIAHQAVGKKIADVKSSIGNTITITPAGFNQFSSANNALTTTELKKVSSLAHVTNITETLTDRLTTIGSSSPNFGKFGSDSSNANNQTSLTSPITVNSNSGDGPHIFINGGGSLPANFSLPISIVGTNDPNNLGTLAGNASGGSITVTSGKMLDGTVDNNQAMVSQSMATKNNLKIGSTFTAYGKTLTVAGIFSSSTKAAEDVVVVSLPTEQTLSGQSGIVTNAVANVDSVDNLSAATTAIKNTLGSNADVTNSQDQVNEAIAPLNNVKTISMYSLIGAVIAGSVIILLTMIMIVRERRHEIGILKAIGASNARIIFQFMSEALTFTVLGAAIGLIIGVAGGSPVTNTLVSNAANANTNSNQTMQGPDGTGPVMRAGNGPGFQAKSTTGHGFLGRNVNSVGNSISNIHANVGWSVLAYGLGAAVFIAVIGSALAGWLIARVRPSEVMRAE